MKILLGSFAGVGCNLLKYLSWCSVKNKEDKVLFFYGNKPDNDNPQQLPFRHEPTYVDSKHIYDDRERNLFYKVFEYPEGCKEEDIYNPDILEMHFPCYIEESKYKSLGLKEFPLSYNNYSNRFIFTRKLFTDPHFQNFRNEYNKLWMDFLKPTPSFIQTLFPESNRLFQIKNQGKRILGVFIRSPVHFVSTTQSKSYEFSEMLLEIKQHMEHFDYILPFTQVAPYFQILQSEFQEKCLSLERKRLPEMSDWTAQTLTDIEFESEITTAITDIYLAGFCDTLLGGMSNLFMSVLFLHPHIQYHIFTCLKDKEGN